MQSKLWFAVDNIYLPLSTVSPHLLLLFLFYELDGDGDDDDDDNQKRIHWVLRCQHLVEYFTYAFTYTPHKKPVRYYYYYITIIVIINIIPILQRQKLRPNSHKPANEPDAHTQVIWLYPMHWNHDNPCTTLICSRSLEPGKLSMCCAEFFKLLSILVSPMVCLGNFCVLRLPGCWKLKVRELFSTLHVPLCCLSSLSVFPFLEWWPESQFYGVFLE